MARKLRIQYPGVIYQVMNRGDHLPAPQRSRQAGREAIFEDDEDRQRLLETLTQACEKSGRQACWTAGVERG